MIVFRVSRVIAWSGSLIDFSGSGWHSTISPSTSRAIAAFDIGSLNSVNLSVPANPIEKIVLDQIYFSVIAGSYRYIKNAENKVAKLKAEGYPAALAEVNPKGLYRVAYGRYNSKKEAINMLYFLKYTLKEDAWFLEER